MLLLLTFAGLSLLLLATTFSHISTAKRDRAFTTVLPAGDAGIQQGLFQLNNGQVVPDSSAPATIELNGKRADWFAQRQAYAKAPDSYSLSSTTQGLVRRLRADAFQGSRFPMGAFADRSVVLRGGNVVGSYDGSTGSTALTGAGWVGSNGSVSFEGNATADRADLYNAEANQVTTRCTGFPCTSVTAVSEKLDIASAESTQFISHFLTTRVCTAYTAPAGATTQLPGGAWCASSVALNGDVTVGPDVTELYVSGAVSIERDVRINFAPGVVPNPSLLRIYSLGQTVTVNNRTTAAAGIIAPLARCTLGAQSTLYGSIMCDTISAVGGWSLYYDERLRAIGDGQFRLRNYREG